MNIGYILINMFLILYVFLVFLLLTSVVLRVKNWLQLKFSCRLFREKLKDSIINFSFVLGLLCNISLAVLLQAPDLATLLGGFGIKTPSDSWLNANGRLAIAMASFYATMVLGVLLIYARANMRFFFLDILYILVFHLMTFDGLCIVFKLTVDFKEYLWLFVILKSATLTYVCYQTKD